MNPLPTSPVSTSSNIANPVDGSTMIGKSVTIRGELSGSEDLFLDGTFEGSVVLSDSRLTLGPNARVKADLKVRDLTIFGVLNGNVQASGRIELRQSAVVTGDIVASRMSIEESASIKGKVELTGRPAAAEASL